MQTKSFRVSLTFQFPSTSYRSPVVYETEAKDKASAIRYARRQADGDGHLGQKMGRATFKAVEVEALAAW